MARRLGERLVLLATRSRSTSSSAGSASDQVEDYAARKGWTLRRGGAVALAQPRLRPRGLSVDATPAAVLWDMDGTLVDTEPYWIESEFEIVDEHGGTWSHEHALNLVGNDLLESGRYIREHSGHRPRAGARSSRSCSTGWSPGSSATVPWRPGAVELLADLRAQRRAAARW